LETDLYEALRNRFDDARVEEDTARWLKADIALAWLGGDYPELIDWYPKMWKAMSAEVGISPGRLMIWARTSHVFPDEKRVAGHEYITFDHHVICASTEDPEWWLNRAEYEEWSTRELRAAIREESGEPGKCRHLKRCAYCQYQEKIIDIKECESCLLRDKAGNKAQKTEG